MEKDTVAPVVENVTPGNKTRINGSSNITVSAYDKSGINTIQMFYEKEQDNWVKISEQTANSQGTAVINWDSKNLKDGSYKVKFVAIDKNGNESEPFTTTYVTDNTGISKIELTDVTADSSYVSLRWKDVAENDFSCFQVEQVLEDGTIKKIGTVSNTLGYHVKNLNPNETYKFQVVGYDTLGNRGIPSDVYSVVTKKDTVSPVINQFGPANLSYSNEIKLSISVKDDVGAVKATFSYSTDEKTWKEITTINKPAKENNTFSYTWDVSGITKDMVYVRVQAWDAAGNENYYVNSTTNEEGILTNKYCLDKTAPDKINDLKATPEDGYVALTWTQPKADDVDHYVIYRAPKETGDYEKLRNIWRNSNYYDTTAKYGKEYSYKITSVDQAGNESECSNESSSSIKKDATKPTVCSISPSDKDTVGANTKIQALVYDNVKVATVTAEIISKKDSSGVGNVIGEKEINKKDALVSFDWDTTGLESGTYSVNVYATDASGYVSEPLTSTFTLDNDAPATPVLTVEEKNWELDLSWTENKETDMQGYEIYRKAYDEQTFKLIGNTTEKTYKDKDVSPYSTYSYYVIAYDNVKNASQSNTAEAQRPRAEDVISPVAYTSEMLTGVAGKEINFDGTASTDNNRIVKYTWDFGDGSAKENGSQIGHIYKNAGTYTAVLTVADAAGNENSITVTVVVYEPTTSGTITLRVVDEQNRPIDSAAVYVNDNSTNGKKHGATNSNGYVTLSGKSGTYNIAAYKKDYLPAETYVDMEAGKNVTATLKLQEGQVVVGELKVEKLELADLIRSGIDLEDPTNYHTFKYEVTMVFKETPIPIKYEIIGSSAKIVSVERKTPKEGATQHENEPKGAKFSFADGVGGEGEVPVLAYLHDTASIKWLKEMYNVELGVINAADASKFVLKDCVATLDLPEGLSLPKISGEEQKLTQVFPNNGVIEAQSSSSVNWVVSGDVSGSYSLSADFNGTLMPFNKAVNATFTTEENFEVQTGEGLTLTIMPENYTITGNEYYVKYELENTSNRYIYNVTTSFGSNDVGYTYTVTEADTKTCLPDMNEGDKIRIGVFAPGACISGMSVLSEPISGHDWGENYSGYSYYRLIKTYGKILEGKNTHVNVKILSIPGHAELHANLTKKYEESADATSTSEESEYGDPVDTTTGAFKESCNALSVNGMSEVSLDLNYNSLMASEISESGYGWSNNLESYITEKNGIASVYWGAGSSSTYVNRICANKGALAGTVINGYQIVINEKAGEGKADYASLAKGTENTKLVRNEDMSYDLTLANDSVYHYNAAGKLVKITDRNTNVVTISYDENKEEKSVIKTVTEKATGACIYLYYENGRLT